MSASAPRIQIAAWVTALRREPRDDGPMDTQMLFGETARVIDTEPDWLHVRADLDHYEGWIAEDAAAVPVLPATHRISALRTYVFSEADLKSAPVALLSMNAKLTLGEARGRYRYVERLRGWVTDRHVRPLGEFETDPAGVAERFLGAPYLWGGKESLGLDCSGLVQTAFEACGRILPRDSGPQERAGGFEDVGREEAARGDLVFWEGHVAIMVDADAIIHANATAMATTIDRLHDFARRVAGEAGPVRRFRRASSNAPARQN